MVLLHLQLDETALDADGESVDWNVGGKIQRLPGVQIEPGAVPRALDPAALLVQLTVGQRPVVVRAAVLDRDDLAAAVEDPDLEVLPFHQATCAGRQLFERADVDDVGQIRSLHSALYPPLGGGLSAGEDPAPRGQSLAGGGLLPAGVDHPPRLRAKWSRSVRRRPIHPP